MAQIKKFTYKWNDGYHHKCDPNVAARVTNELEKQGKLTAKNLVDVSRPVDAPLHPEFEWDDMKAAEKFREEQARNIIRSIQIVYEDYEPRKMYCNIRRTDPEYMSVDVAISKPDTRQMLLDNAFRDMEIFQKKYEMLTELANVFDAMMEVMSVEKIA